MPADSTTDPHPGFNYLGETDLRFLATHLRGVREARIRFLATTPDFEAEMIDVLLALGVSTSTERLAEIAPYPRRRYVITYRGPTAVVTVAPDAALMG